MVRLVVYRTPTLKHINIMRRTLNLFAKEDEEVENIARVLVNIKRNKCFRICTTCFTPKTPMWRYHEGRLMCNACALHIKKSILINRTK